MPRRRPVSVGWIAQLTCEARGARPQAELTWWREGKEVEGTTETVLEDGNLTVSTYAFTPRAEDNGKSVTCKAHHATLEMEPIADTVTLNVHCKYESSSNKLHIKTFHDPLNLSGIIRIVGTCELS
ncbi:uncharacterized protein CDAR_574721 [Caerostris darwini]|uniref:Ig-like domain-containing protein n=1 Tax=Caerostris darwini TaxID=1538125 RepID=A0AAV4SWD1_9ARAC|nr:uncharacterized protein CDAR_574721 [Caerostris darwini]